VSPLPRSIRMVETWKQK